MSGYYEQVRLTPEEAMALANGKGHVKDGAFIRGNAVSEGSDGLLRHEIVDPYSKRVTYEYSLPPVVSKADSWMKAYTGPKYRQIAITKDDPSAALYAKGWHS